MDKCSICKLEKQQIDEGRQEFIQQKTKLELEIKDLQEAIKEDNNAKETDKKQMAKLEEKIKTKEEALSKITPEYNEKKTSEGDISARFVIFSTPSFCLNTGFHLVCLVLVLNITFFRILWQRQFSS